MRAEKHRFLEHLFLFTPLPKDLVLSPLDQLLWAVIGLLLTISGVFIEVSLPYLPLAWPPAWEQVQTYSLGTTLQVGAVLLVGCMGGRYAAALSQIAYLALGLSGVQIFAHGGGLSYLQESTFGYLLGFVPGAWICGYLAFRNSRRLESMGLSCLLGLLAIHLTGILYLTGQFLFQQLPGGWWPAVMQYSLIPFPGQLIVLCAVVLIAFILRRVLFY